MIKIVSANGWGVARLQKAGLPQGGMLYVTKLRGGKLAKGDGHGRTFDTDAEAADYCLSRGYTQYYRPKGLAMFKFLNRRRLTHNRSMALKEARNNAKSHADLIRICDAYTDRLVKGLSCDTLMALKFWNGMMAAIRHNRPDLFEDKK